MCHGVHFCFAVPTYTRERIVRKVDIGPAEQERRTTRLGDGLVGAVLVVVPVGGQRVALIDQVTAAPGSGKVGGGRLGHLEGIRLNPIRVVEGKAWVGRGVDGKVEEAADDAHGLDVDLELVRGA